MSDAANGARAGATWQELVAETAVSVAVATLFTISCLHIDVSPLERIGQISGLASLGLRFTLGSLALIGCVVVATRRWPAALPRVSRFACASLAGLVGGFVAGAIIVALHGTRWGLNGAAGDSGDLIEWARGYAMYDNYPPLPVRALAAYADLFGFKVHYAVKHLQIIGTAALGPAAYLAWRLLLRPGWALGVGLVASLPLIEAGPYKPYGSVVLIALVPLVIRFLDELRRLDDETAKLAIVRSGLIFGLVFGLLFITYSGWFQWAALGAFVATLLVFPWQTALRQGALLLGTTLAAFLAIAGAYLFKALLAGALPDNYVYFDVLTEPAYVAMFKGDLPGPIPIWPPTAELAGVGVYTLLLVAGTGVAIALGRGRSIVVGVAAIMAGAWVMRFWYAHDLWDTRLVQLYPRTTPVILYCLLALSCYALALVAERHRRDKPDSPLHGANGFIGALCALCLLFGSAASSIGNEYMPYNSFPFAPGRLAWTAHHAKEFWWGQKPR